MKIKVTIKSDGTVVHDVIGEDSSCITKTAGLEAELGEVVDRDLKPEAQLAPEQPQQNQQFLSI
jgi:Protein of unknown function (DUF2997)